MKQIFVLTLALLFLGSCVKDNKGCEPVPVASEETVMNQFAVANNLTVTKHSTGLLYQIVNPGYGAMPSRSSVVTVSYVGRKMDGTVFDETAGNPFTNRLGNLIEGWNVGLPLIKKGGTIRMIIPSSMAYGCTGQGTIPANSPLYFEVELMNVQ